MNCGSILPAQYFAVPVVTKGGRPELLACLSLAAATRQRRLPLSLRLPTMSAVCPNKSPGRRASAKAPTNSGSRSSSQSPTTGGSIRQDIAGSIAHATMLSQVGLITADECRQIIEGLRSIERDIDSGTFKFDESQEDIHMVVEAALIERIGEPDRRLHTGRSRNDQVALDLSLWIREQAAVQGGLLHDLCRAYVAMAIRSGEIVMPILYASSAPRSPFCGAECLAWCAMFARDARRCTARSCRKVIAIFRWEAARSLDPRFQSIRALPPSC